jgi:hypothetical protein
VRVLVGASLVQALLAVALAFSHSSLAAILALTALLSAGSAVSAPAEFALVGALAGPREHLVRANGVMEAARYAGFAAGPLLAAGLAALAGTREALLVNAASFLAIAVAATLMRARRPPVEHRAGERARDGFAHLLADRVLRASVIAAVAALAFVSATITAEVFYVKDVLGAGDSGYALVTAVWMAGMVAGATRLAERVRRDGFAVAALVALGVQGAAIAGQTAWAVLPVALAGYAIGGLAHGAKNTLLRALIGERVPERLHGRAFAAYNALRNGAELAALGAGGLLVAGVGARTAMLVAGLGPVLAAAGGLLALRGSRPRTLAPVPASAR